MKNRPYILVSEKGQSNCGGSVSPEEWEEAPDCAYNPGSIQANLEYFHDFLQKRGSAENTVNSYLTSVRLYHSLYAEITVENLQDYKAWLLNHYKPSTVNTRIYGINQYVAALQAWAEGNPGSEVYGPRLTAYKLPSVRHQQKPFLNNVISKRDYERLKRCLKRDNNMFWYFVVRFLGATGARVSELTQIKAEHVQIGCMDLYSKGGKVRRIYFPEKLCGEMLSWLAMQGRETGFIFINRQGKPITPRGISSQLKVLARQYKITPDTVYPHSFRHRFAKNFLMKFNDISLLADLMGHESIETTRIYLTRSSDEQRELIDKIVTW
ncbi:MAG: tyrosine-type recombinase/integrase [Clostridium sp.]|nr:tyrosine-type recombinase/integrase [Clostridium sp.]